ncbi:MAG: FecR domain-containing protein [Alistipes sp.]|nr:FecR domain-containing protein [Alistipes sp.]
MTARKGKPEAAELVKKFFEKRYPADIERRFHLWLLSGENGREKEQALESMWEAVPYGKVSDARSSLREVREKLGFTVSSRRRLPALVLRVAAVVIPLMVIAAAVLMRQQYNAATDSQAVYLQAYAGGSAALPDGTVVNVKEGIVTYPEVFSGDVRRVKFEGTAFFTVSAGAANPFIIEGPLVTVRVTGTRFLFTAAGADRISRVSLVEGTVDIFINGADPVHLTEGNQLTYDPQTGRIEITALPAALLTAEGFTTGRLNFSGATLEEILRAVALAHGLEIEMEPGFGGSKTYEVKFTGEEDIEQIIGILRLLTEDFDYQLDRRSIYIE